MRVKHVTAGVVDRLAPPANQAISPLGLVLSGHGAAAEASHWNCAAADMVCIWLGLTAVLEPVN
ncbi:MAG: hypothetical protein ACUVWA_13105 [Candidatus Oleimicrobiaceae bacterium]